MPWVVALLLAASPERWPLTAAELEGKAYHDDVRVEDSPPCSAKTRAPIELRLFTKVKQLRLTVKNCTGKTVKLLHDQQLQPSKLLFAAKVKAPFDERARMKFDSTVRLRDFASLAGGEERVLADETFAREGEEYTVLWHPFRYEHVPLGKQKVRVQLDAWVDSGLDEETGKQTKVEGAAAGSFKSNEVTVQLP